MKIFLSYSNADKKLAGQIKKIIENNGLDVFLAHDDIEPSEEWVKTILSELNECDVFIPLLTKKFNKSNWTDQETGFALCRDIPIISLKVDVDPHGFIAKFQALRLNIDKLESSIARLFKTFASKPSLKKIFRNALIEDFSNSNSFEEAKRKTKLLLAFDGYSSLQISKIMKATVENNQIYMSFDARDKLRYFIRQYEGSIKNKKLLKDFKQRTARR